MAGQLSTRLRAVVDALPLKAGMRVVEIGCGPGAMAREPVRRVGPDGHVLAVDSGGNRSRPDRRRTALMTVVRSSAETLVLPQGQDRYDL